VLHYCDTRTYYDICSAIYSEVIDWTERTEARDRIGEMYGCYSTGVYTLTRFGSFVLPKVFGRIPLFVSGPVLVYFVLPNFYPIPALS
jgi:hypothetical protein